MGHEHNNLAQRDGDREGDIGSAGSHPVGTGLGAAGGAAAGATIGAVISVFAAPIGAVVGGVVGAVVGGLAGGEVAGAVSGEDEEAYWRKNYAKRPYVAAGEDYDDYRPAYRYGWEAAVRNPRVSFDQAEPVLGRDWEMARGTSRLEWNQARDAARDAWERVCQRIEAATRDSAAGPEAHRETERH